MKKKDIEYFRNLLTDQLEELLNQADDTDNTPDPREQDDDDPVHGR